MADISLFLATMTSVFILKFLQLPPPEHVWKVYILKQM